MSLVAAGVLTPEPSSTAFLRHQEAASKAEQLGLTLALTWDASDAGEGSTGNATISALISYSFNLSPIFENHSQISGLFNFGLAINTLP